MKQCTILFPDGRRMDVPMDAVTVRLDVMTRPAGGPKQSARASLDPVQPAVAFSGDPNFIRAIHLIGAERGRQLELGYTADHDDAHDASELAAAAACYAYPRLVLRFRDGQPSASWWPWDGSPPQDLGQDRTADLAKAGALILAELERILRAADLIRETASARVETASEHLEPRCGECRYLHPGFPDRCLSRSAWPDATDPALLGKVDDGKLQAHKGRKIATYSGGNPVRPEWCPGHSPR